MSRRNKHLSFVLVMAFAVVFNLSAVAQQPPPPKYDLHSEAKIKGTVEELKLPTSESKKAIAELALKSDSGTVEIYLCPKAFLAEMGITFDKGDELEVTASKIKQASGDLFLAREVVKGNDTIVLRDDKGNPVWSAH